MNDDLEPEQDLAEQILLLLREQPDGCSEYELIQQLKARHSTHIPHLPLIDKLVLFRTHFLVFNALYRLRDRLWGECSQHLQISPLCVQLQPYVPGTSGITTGDPLRDYYLDMTNLRDTDEAEVERLLASFWSRMRATRWVTAAATGTRNRSAPRWSCSNWTASPAWTWLPSSGAIDSSSASTTPTAAAARPAFSR